MILELVDDFTSKAARAAVAAEVLSKAVDDIGGNSSSAAKDAEGLSKSTEKVGKSSTTTSTSVGRLAATLDKQTGATTLSTRAMVAKTLADRGALEAADKLGVSVRDVTDAAMGNHDALTRMNGSLTDSRRRMEEAGASTTKFDTDAQRLVGSVSRMSVEMSTAQRRASLLGNALGEAGRESDKLAKTAGNSTAKIDRYSGRLGLLADAAITLGPALIPLGASTIPLLTASLTGLGAAAGGIGAAVLAFHGIGDGLKAIDAYNLDPTVANLKKLRLEEEKLGPAGMQFAQQLSNLEPLLKSLQLTGRQRMFPDLETGISDLLTRVPDVQRIIARLSDGMGQLASEAGASLSSDAWTPFFDFIKSDAEPTLLAFGRATGNVALGLSNLMVAFAPLSRGFASGLEHMAKSFADWSAHLDTNQGFQQFLAYVQESGPKVLDLLGSLVSTFASIVVAAAPLGQDVLPVLTEIVKVLGIVANSPFGGAFVTALVAMRAYVRAAQLATLTTAAFGKASAAAGVNLNTMGGKARFAVTSLIGLEVAGQVIQGLADAAAGAAPDVEKLTAALIAADQGQQLNSLLGGKLQDALSSLDPSGIDGVAHSLNNLADKGGTVGKALEVDLGGFLGLTPSITHTTVASDKATKTFQSLDSALTEIATTGGPKKAQAAFDALAKSQGLSASQQQVLMGQLPQFSGALQHAANTAALTARSIHQVSAASAAAKADVLQLNDALAALSGWFDKRQAMRDYAASLHDLTKSLKNGLQPKDVAKIDAVGQSMLQVANAIKDPALKRDFLASARASLEKIASGSGPKAKDAIDKVVAAADRLGVTAPVVKIGADDRRAKNAITSTSDGLTHLDNTTATPKVRVDTANSVAELLGIQAAINRLHGKTITIQTVHTDSSGVGYQHGAGKQAAGGLAGSGPRSRRPFPANARRFARGGLADQTPLFTSEGPRFYGAAYRHNSPYAVPNPFDKNWPYQTPLTRAQELVFERWVDANSIPFQPGSHLSDYDMRGFWKKAHPKSWKAGQHFPDTFKTPYDTTFSHESKYATENNPFVWRGQYLVDTSKKPGQPGYVVFAPPPGGEQRVGRAGGGSIYGPGGPRDDLIPAWLSNGEYVVQAAAVDRYGEGFFHRLNTMQFADGGRAGGHSGNVGSLPGPGNNLLWLNFTAGVDTATSSLKSLHIAADAETKALDKAKARLSSIRSSESSLASTVAGTFGLDSVFNLSAASSNPWAAGASGGSFTPTANLNAITAQAQGFIADVKTLQANGVKGPALQAILSQGPAVVHAMAQMSPADLSAEVSAFNQASALVGQASALAGTAVYGSQETAAVKELKGIRKDLHVLTQAAKAADKANQKGHKATAHAAAHSGSNAAANARRRSRAS